MPFLDAKALETDPEGMAFLRSVIGQKSRKKAAPGLSRTTGQPQAQAASPSAPESAPGKRSQAPHPLEAA
jgi:hypothetical protein